MAKKTMEKNSVLKFFEALKDNFFNILLLGSILSVVAMLIFSLCIGLSWLLVHLIGDYAVFNYLTFLPFILFVPCATAVLKIFRNFIRQVPVMLFSDLKQAFCQNFVQSLLLGIMQYIAVVLFCIAYNYYSLTAQSSGGTLFAQVGLAVCVVFALFTIIISCYAMMMIVTLDLKLREIIKNSGIFSVLCLPRNALMLIVLALWLGICGALAYTAAASGVALVGGLVLMFLLLFMIGLTLYIIAFFTFAPIKKHILDPYYEKHPEQTSVGLENSKSQSENDDETDNSEQQKELPEYVYHNGRMVHRSIFEREKLVDDDNEDEN